MNIEALGNSGETNQSLESAIRRPISRDFLPITRRELWVCTGILPLAGLYGFTVMTRIRRLGRSFME